MAAKKTHGYFFFFALTAVMAVVYYIATRESDSAFAGLAKWIGSQAEGFDAPPPPSVRCPSDKKFFVSAGGKGFCCGAEVNPYGATCSDPAKVCAMERGLPDPRGPSFGFVPLCK
jgi:hypothetical protein